MVVLIAKKLPPSLRGKLKLWFVEVQPNVFVSGIKDALAAELADFIFEHATEDSGLILFRSTKKSPGYDIVAKGTFSDSVVDINGMKLIQSLVVETEINI